MRLWPLALEMLLLQILITQCETIEDPTLKPANPFSHKDDAITLYGELVCEKKSRDLRKVDKLWFHRTHAQRMQISDYYNIRFHGSYFTSETLQSDLQMRSDGSLDHLYSNSFLSPQSLLGKTINQVIEGKWKEVGAIEEMVCCNDKGIKNLIADYYNQTFKVTIENHIGTFRKEDQEYEHVLQHYCWKGLCQKKKLKPEDADKEAKALKDIDPDKDGEKFKKKLNELLENNCEPDMKLIFEKYRQGQNGIAQAVEKAFKVDRVERAYNRLVRYIEDTCKFYTDELDEAVDGWGTDIDRINRIVLSRCERDLGCILKKYKEIHGKTFTERLTSDTLGESRYRESIRYLCGKT